MDDSTVIYIKIMTLFQCLYEQVKLTRTQTSALEFAHGEVRETVKLKNFKPLNAKVRIRRLLIFAILLISLIHKSVKKSLQYIITFNKRETFVNLTKYQFCSDN